MKRLVIVLGALLLTMSSYAQSPEKFSYQAVVRNSADELVINSTTPIKVSILKTDASGTVVYEETHAPTTNVNGLLSIEIGQGTAQSGALDMIDWGTDTYYIKTEIDIDNNASYDITGTSQLLSVPYALNANTLTGGIDKAHVDSLTAIIGTSEAKIVVLETDMANMEASLVVLDTQISTAETDIAALEAADIASATMISTSEARITSLENSIDSLENCIDSLKTADIALEARIAAIELLTPAIGDYRDGGVVFWLDGNGGGLVCTITDQSGLINWHNGSNSDTGASATAIGTGQANTTAIIANLGAGNYPAQICDDLVLNGYSDWFLPSIDELTEMYLNRAIINSSATANGGANFSTLFYWSSSQQDGNANNAWIQYFSNGSQGLNAKGNTAYTRAVRVF